MIHSPLEDLEEASDHPMPRERHTVTVEFTVPSDCPEDAVEIINELITEGVLAIISNQDREPLEAYDIINVELAEIL